MAIERRRAATPMVVLETALPAKFEETMVEATGAVPPRPAALQGIEVLPKRLQVIDNDVAVVRALIDAELQACSA